MKYSLNIFVVSVLVLGLLSSPIAFAQTSDDGEDITIELEESISVTSNDSETETDETETDETETDETETDETETDETEI